MKYYLLITQEGERIMKNKESDLPTGLAKPAQRALAGAGYLQLEQFTKLSEAEVLQLHVMGPKALEQIRSALAEKGLAFANGS
ncbi:helix-hairpin-helix domain-containing protein [Peribacillus butanolivorans]|uniref:DNA-binding protein n=1 Tax=Peribacillus butanolivorans TaxID=421767 RepID=UPI00366FF5D4